MARLVIYFKAYDIRIVFVSIACIRIHVAYKSSNILFLCSNSFSIAMNGTFIIMRGKATGGLVTFRITVAKICL